MDATVIGGSGRDVLNLDHRRERVRFARDGDWVVVTPLDPRFGYTMRLREVEEVVLYGEGRLPLADLLPAAPASRREALARVPLGGGLMSALGDLAPALTGGLLAPPP